jgi:hypothetical protein
MSATEPRVWTAKQFTSATTPLNPTKRHRGPQLHLIDTSLKTFEDGFILSDDARKRLAVQIMQACKNWLVAKAGKSTGNSGKRRHAIEQLGNQLFAWLQYKQFEERKAALPNGFANVRAMRPGYLMERTLYEQSHKKKMPVSASYIHEVMEHQQSNAYNATANTYRGRTFGQLTARDFQDLDSAYGGQISMADPMGDPGSMAKTQVPRMVLFLNKQERIKRQLIVQPDGLLYEGFDKPFDTGIMVRAYVIDEYGNFFSSNEVFDRQYSFNHSTFNAGKEVICAGTLKAKDGQLTKITNSSGHYKPSRTDLHNAVQFLANAGADLTKLQVTVAEPDATRPGKMIEHDYDNAQTFINNMNAVPSRSVPEP